MKTILFALISAVIFPVAGWAQHPTVVTGGRAAPVQTQSRTSYPSAPQPATHQATPSATQVSKSTYSPTTHQQVNVDARKSSPATTSSPSRIKSHYNQSRSKTFNPATISREATYEEVKNDPPPPTSTSGGTPPNISKPNYLENAPDTTLVLSKQPKPVVFYKRSNRIYTRDYLSAYGVQLGYYKDLQSARKELIKYKSRFKVAGFVCEDWNLMDDRDVEKWPYRLILGHFTNKAAAYRFLQRVRHFFPFSFIVKYA